MVRGKYGSIDILNGHSMDSDRISFSEATDNPRWDCLFIGIPMSFSDDDDEPPALDSLADQVAALRGDFGKDITDGEGVNATVTVGAPEKPR